MLLNAPGSTHDARLLRHTKVSTEIQSGRAIPQQCLDLEEALGEIPSVTIGDTLFPQFAWLLKAFPKSKDPKKRYFNVKLWSARAVTENAFGMLKGRWPLIYKKWESKMHNVKYVFMACVLQHNLCIVRQDPCNPRWKHFFKNTRLCIPMEDVI